MEDGRALSVCHDDDDTTDRSKLSSSNPWMVVDNGLNLEWFEGNRGIGWRDRDWIG